MFGSSLLRPQSSLPVSEVIARMTKGKLILIDVREMAEVQATGKAKGAIVVPLSLLGLKCDPRAPDCVLDPTKEIAVYCASGGRSSMAAQTLSQFGYKHVHNLGGLKDWLAGGGQVERL